MKTANPDDTVYMCLANAWDDWRSNEDLMEEWVYFRSYIRHGCGFTYSESTRTPIIVNGSSYSKDRSMLYQVIDEKLFTWFIMRYSYSTLPKGTT